MCLLRRITCGEFSEFVQEKKVPMYRLYGGLSDPINHEVFGGDSLLPLACSIHLEIITFGTTIQIT